MLTMVQKAIRKTHLVLEKQLLFIFRCCVEGKVSSPAVHFILTFQHFKWLCLHYWANKHLIWGFCQAWCDHSDFEGLELKITNYRKPGKWNKSFFQEVRKHMGSIVNCVLKFYEITWNFFHQTLLMSTFL